MHRLASLVAASTVFVSAQACLSPDGAPADFDMLVADHRAALAELTPDRTVIDCGGYVVDGEAAESTRAANRCFLDAWATCRAAELQLIRSTPNDLPVYEVLFVEPHTATTGTRTVTTCEIAVFRDTSEDGRVADFAELTLSYCDVLAAEGDAVALHVSGCAVDSGWDPR